MKLSGFLEEFYEASGNLSEINRQFAFAGIAIIWIFKIGDAPNYEIPEELILPAILLIGALTSDICQYLYKSINLAAFHRKKEKNKNAPADDPDVTMDVRRNYPTWGFFIIKVGLVIASYILILSYLVSILRPN